ncbi:hypothetical protein Esti_002608 [Eimeria stiedai]
MRCSSTRCWISAQRGYRGGLTSSSYCSSSSSNCSTSCSALWPPTKPKAAEPPPSPLTDRSWGGDRLRPSSRSKVVAAPTNSSEAAAPRMTTNELAAAAAGQQQQLPYSSSSTNTSAAAAALPLARDGPQQQRRQQQLLLPLLLAGADVSHGSNFLLLRWEEELAVYAVSCSSCCSSSPSGLQQLQPAAAAPAPAAPAPAAAAEGSLLELSPPLRLAPRSQCIRIHQPSNRGRGGTRPINQLVCAVGGAYPKTRGSSSRAGAAGARGAEERLGREEREAWEETAHTFRYFLSAQAAGRGPRGMEGTAASSARGGSAFPVFLGSPESDSLSPLPQVRIHSVSSTEPHQQQQQQREREWETGGARGATSSFNAAQSERSFPEQQQQQQVEGRDRRGPPTEQERLRVREKYRERLKERKLQIYRRALEEVVQREKEGARTCLAFRIQLPTRFGENLFLVGSEACVGSWCLDRAVPMLWGEGNVWSLALALPNGVRRLEYKYVIKEGPRTTWEPGANHTWEARSSSGCSRPGVSPAAGPITVSDSWGAGSGRMPFAVYVNRAGAARRQGSKGAAVEAGLLRLNFFAARAQPRLAEEAAEFLVSSAEPSSVLIAEWRGAGDNPQLIPEAMRPGGKVTAGGSTTRHVSCGDLRRAKASSGLALQAGFHSLG